MECVQGEPGLAMVPSLPVQLHRVTGISIHLALGVAKDQSSYLHNLKNNSQTQCLSFPNGKCRGSSDIWALKALTHGCWSTVPHAELLSRHFCQQDRQQCPSVCHGDKNIPGHMDPTCGEPSAPHEMAAAFISKEVLARKFLAKMAIKVPQALSPWANRNSYL